jgi:Zn-dependent protease with chaperone function
LGVFNIKIAFLCLVIVLTASCSGISYQVVPPSNASITSASREISSANVSYHRNSSMLDARDRVERIFARLKPSARELCRYLAERSTVSCSDWQVAVEDSQVFNAYATGANEIVVSKGIVEQSRYPEEVAFILAHELSHHMLNHLGETRINEFVGSLLGILLSAAIASVALEEVDCNPDYENCDDAYDLAERIIGTGANAGAYVANHKYAVAQESEADMLAAYILSRSNYSLIRARQTLLNIARMGDSTNTRSSFFDSHPAGPERLAQFDTVIQEVLSNVNRAP